jgi:hypothetical protein
MPPRDFSRLSPAEADAYLRERLATAPGRLAAFRREVAATGGPAEEELDGLPESLVPLWEWFLRREGNRGDAERGGPPPDWYEPDPPEVGGERLSPATLRDLDGIATYLPEVFLHELPESEWIVGHAPPAARYVAQGKPVLRLPHGEELDPVKVAYALGVRVALYGEGRKPDALLAAYRAWLP